MYDFEDFLCFYILRKKHLILKVLSGLEDKKGNCDFILHANLFLIVVTFYLPAVTVYRTIAIFPKKKKKVCYHTTTQDEKYIFINQKTVRDRFLFLFFLTHSQDQEEQHSTARADSRLW